MTVRRIEAGTIALEGTCPSEDAETLVQLLLETPDATVDWRMCEGAHAAVIQVLLAAEPALMGVPRDPALAQWVYPILTDATA